MVAAAWAACDIPRIPVSVPAVMASAQTAWNPNRLWCTVAP